MRLVLDTNTALSGLLWGGTPGRLIDAAVAGQVQLFSSTALLAELQGVFTRDPADDQVLAAALAASADLIVSGDAHLLDLKQWQGMPVVPPAVAVERLGAAH